MKILIVSSFLIFPETRFGGSKRIYNIAKSLEEEHDISVICFDGSKEKHQWNATTRFKKFLFLDLVTPDNIYRKLTHHMDMNNVMNQNRNHLDAFFCDAYFDCVILAYSLAPNLLRIPAVLNCGRIIYIEGDLVIARADLQRGNQTVLIKKILKKIRYLQVLRYYTWFLSKVHLFFLSTNTEIFEINKRFPKVKTMQLPIGLDLTNINLLPLPENMVTAGFIGNYEHEPNFDAIKWYLEYIHPKLLSAHPDYQFVIAGMNIPNELIELAAKDSRLIIMGALENLEFFYKHISFVVSPIVSGKGVRTKVIEAAAYGRAIVSTRLGADGTEPIELLIGDTPEDFFACCIRLITTNSNLKTILTENRKVVENYFSNSAIKNLLLKSF